MPTLTFDLAANFAQLLAVPASVHPDRTALVHRGTAVTYRTIARRGAAMARALRDRGTRPGDRVAVLIRDPADAIAAFFAVLAVGAIGVNVNELYRPRQIEHVLANSEARALLTERDVLNQLPRGIATAAEIVDVGSVPDTDGPLVVEARAADAPAEIKYTSASTGLPKGVVMSHGALWAGVRIVAGYLGIRPDDRIASVLPFSFVYGFNQLTTALYTGATLIVDRSTIASEIVATLRRERVSVLAAVPPLWQQLLSVPDFRARPLEHLRVMTNAGGRLPPAAVRELRRAQPQASLFLMYGLTEVFRSTFLPPAEVDEHPDSIGRAIPESVVYVVRDDGTLAPDHEVGELVHGGPTVGLGYHGDPDLTARVFRVNPFLSRGAKGPARVVFSGDLVRREASGLLYYVGRRDRMIKTLGYRVSPDEVSDVIAASGEVTDVAIVTEPDAVRGERIVACVALKESGDLDRLMRYCRLELPRHMQPARFASVHAIPRNANGKHDIQAVRQLVAAGAPPV